jgi:hypothetical protein
MMASVAWKLSTKKVVWARLQEQRPNLTILSWVRVPVKMVSVAGKLSTNKNNAKIKVMLCIIPESIPTSTL